MAKQKKIYDKEYSKHIGAVILLITSFIAFALTTTGTPLGQLNERTSQQCYTFWGIRPNCWNAAYSWRIDEDTCVYRRVRWAVSEAFSIVAIFTLALLVGACWVQLSGSNIKGVITFLIALAVGSTTAPFACVVAIHVSDYCGQRTLSGEFYKYGAGFCLFVTSFCLQVVGAVLFMFLEP